MFSALPLHETGNRIRCGVSGATATPAPDSLPVTTKMLHARCAISQWLFLHATMRQMEYPESGGCRVVEREWLDARNRLHRASGPAHETWTVFPDGAHVLTAETWSVHGAPHRDGRPAQRVWAINADGTRILTRERWYRHGVGHRANGPASRTWSVRLQNTVLQVELWRVRGMKHRSDGFAAHWPYGKRDEFWWQGDPVSSESLLWLRRGQSFLCILSLAVAHALRSQNVTPATWVLDPRMLLFSSAPPLGAKTYSSVAGGMVLLCM